MTTPAQRWMRDCERAAHDRDWPGHAFALEKLVQAAKIEECNMTGEQRYMAYWRECSKAGMQRPLWLDLPERERQVWEALADPTPKRPAQS